jgi:hypothetical protein
MVLTINSCSESAKQLSAACCGMKEFLESLSCVERFQGLDVKKSWFSKFVEIPAGESCNSQISVRLRQLEYFFG